MKVSMKELFMKDYSNLIQYICNDHIYKLYINKKLKFYIYKT